PARVHGMEPPVHARRVGRDVEAERNHAARPDGARSAYLSGLGRRRLVPRLQLGTQWITCIATCGGKYQQRGGRRGRATRNGGFMELPSWSDGFGSPCGKTRT